MRRDERMRKVTIARGRRHFFFFSIDMRREEEEEEGKVKRWSFME